MTASSTEAKSCSSCKQALPFSAFSAGRHYKDGYRGQCKSCRAAWMRDYKVRTNYQAPSYPSRKRKRFLNPAGERIGRLRRKYGLSAETYNAMLESQGGKCAICSTADPKSRHKSFHVDHCHKTGRVRGLLCNPCNLFLGRAGDDIAGVMRFVGYLQSRSKGQ